MGRHSSLKSLPDSFSPWPVAICKVQRRISQDPPYRVTVRATRRFDDSPGCFPPRSPTLMIRSTMILSLSLSVGKRTSALTMVFYLTYLVCRNFFSILLFRKHFREPTIRGEALLPNVSVTCTSKLSNSSFLPTVHLCHDFLSHLYIEIVKFVSSDHLHHDFLSYLCYIEISLNPCSRGDVANVRKRITYTYGFVSYLYIEINKFVSSALLITRTMILYLTYASKLSNSSFLPISTLH